MLWGFSRYEYLSLREQFLRARDFQLSMVATIQAELYNTAGKNFDRFFKGADFMPGAEDQSIEARAQKLMDQGYEPAAAVAIASSTQSKEHGLHIVESELRMADAKKEKLKGKPARNRLMAG